MGDSEPQRQSTGLAVAMARMSTGAKVFLILVGALFPLALIALLITIQTTRHASTESREQLAAISNESASIAQNMLGAQVAQLGEGLAALEADPRDAPACTRLVGTFATQSGVRFAVFDARGRLLCGLRFEAGNRAALRPAQVDAVLNDTGLALHIGGTSGARAVAFYPLDALRTLIRPSGFVPDYGAALVEGDDRLVLRRLAQRGPLESADTTRTPLSIDGLTLEMSMPIAPITSPLVIATVLLVLMWIAAAAIGWFVVDILLIRPMRRLRTSVANYHPGDVIDLRRFGAVPAQELRELGETFQQISRTVQAHEADLAEGLVRQTRLTREVHHRVKNNLQVIASLINFHARGAQGPEAAEAYASIQRRVDALAVVHRHHYAEMEENRGLELRAVMGELASNIRATAPDSTRLAITLDVEPVLVSQDVATAVAFLLTEIIELAMRCNPGAQIRISLKIADDDPARATLRVVSPALVESPEFEALLESRYGRVIGGLARQMRTRLHHDPLVGAYESTIAINGRP